MRHQLLIILSLCILPIFLIGCGRYPERDRKPDNDFSKAVKDEFENAFYYRETREDDLLGTYYSFQIKDFNKETVTSFADFTNEYFQDSDEKVVVDIWYSFGYGLTGAFSLANYSSYESTQPQYDGLYCLGIGVRDDDNPFWSDISNYDGIKNVESLEISEYLDEYAKKEGIDWYEIYPDLEEIIVHE